MKWALIVIMALVCVVANMYAFKEGEVSGFVKCLSMLDEKKIVKVKFEEKEDGNSN